MTLSYAPGALIAFNTAVSTFHASRFVAALCYSGEGSLSIPALASSI